MSARKGSSTRGYPNREARKVALPEPELRAVDGRKPGRRGKATRERLLRCAAKLLDKRSYRDLSVSEIARCAQTSPATFYQYFPDVEEAILALAHELAEDARGITTLIEESRWSGDEATRSARALVDAFLDLWERHRAVLRVVDLATAEGDLRFQNIRTHILNEITLRLRDVIRPGPGLDPMAHAAALVSMLAHVAAHRYGYEFWGIRIEAVRDSVVRLVATGISGG